MKKKKLMSLMLIAVMALSMTACGSKDEIPTSEEIEEGDVTLVDPSEETSESEEHEKKEEVSDEISGDFDADVKAGLLYVNNDGVVVDKDGNMVDVYSYITATDETTLTSDGDIMAGYTLDGMQIIIDQEYLDLVKNYEPTASSYMDELRSIADPSKEGQKVPLGDDNLITTQDLTDNGGPYYSDIIWGNWWTDGVNGTCPTPVEPDLIVGLPHKLSFSIYESGIDASTVLDQFRLVDEETCTMDSIMRSQPDGLKLYGMYVQNIEKDVDSNGYTYFTGYVNYHYIAVYGDFSNLMNGDDVFVYAAYNGLNVNDIPIFDGGYIEFIQ